MSKLTRREFVAGVSALTLTGDAIAAETGALVLWFKKPADKRIDALPIGNGRLGAMVFGGVKEERLQYGAGPSLPRQLQIVAVRQRK